MGENDRGEKYNDLSLICRDAAHVDRFKENATSPPKRAAGGRDVTKGMVRAQDVDPRAFETPGVANGF
jgi:hypothetical protein